MAQKFLNGIASTGNILPSADSTYDLGHGSYRWANLNVDAISTTSSFVSGGTIALQSNISTLNKAQTAYIGFATRNVSGSETLMDLSNVGTINGVTLTDFVSKANGGTFLGDVTVDSTHFILKDGSPEFYFHTEGNHYNWLVAAQENVDGAFEIGHSSATATALDQDASNYTRALTLHPTTGATFAGNVSMSGLSATAGSFTQGVTIADVIDGDFTALRLMNQKTYGSGTGTNEKVRFVMGISESGISFTGREGFSIDVGVAVEGSSSDCNVDFKVRDGGVLGTYQTVTGGDKSVTFAGSVTSSSGTSQFSVVNASAYQLNGTYIVDSSRNLVNISQLRFGGSDALIDTASTTSATATTIVATIAHATYSAIFFDFVIKNGTNVRAGTLAVCHDGTTVEYAETSTVDLGDTSDVTLSSNISGTAIRLIATSTSSTWTIKSLIRAI